MKAHLMFKDRDFDPQRPLPPQAAALTQDFELEVLIGAMADGDAFISDVCSKAVLDSLVDADAIRYRQQVLADCLQNRALVAEIYAIAVESLDVRKKSGWGFFGGNYPSGLLTRAIGLLEGYLPLLERLRDVAETHRGDFESDGFRTLLKTLTTELSPDYFAEVRAQLKALRFRDGVLLSARLGRGNKGTDYVLRRDSDPRSAWQKLLFGPHPKSVSFTVAPRDEAGWRNLEQLKDRGIALVADALGQSADHVLSFFQMLRQELAFYMGCVNLHERLAALGEPATFPVVAAAENGGLTARGLYDACLALSLERTIVANDVSAAHKDLIVVTGANQGGKSTFLRSVGLAQLMMQSGMFVAAGSFSCDLRAGLFTHYKREEDAAMTSGKFDEELTRMSEIVDLLGDRSTVLFNESFASTNEREGSEIAYQIVTALLERGIRVVFVTHMYDLAHRLSGEKTERALFLRAERAVDGKRSFKLSEGAPLPTAFGKDLYDKIFGDDVLSAGEDELGHDHGTMPGGGAADLRQPLAADPR